MSAVDDSQLAELLPQRFATLWHGRDPNLDVFAFLAAYPEATPRERLGVLLIDQRERWRSGAGLPAEAYLDAAPDIADRPELRLRLVQGELVARHQRGEEVDPAEMLRRFPELREALAAFSAAGLLRSTEARPPSESSKTATWPPEADQHTPKDDRATMRSDRHHADGHENDLGRSLCSGRFTIHRKLGSGGMGVVHRAYDSQRDELVAIKTMRWLNPVALYRFKNDEFRTLADLSHPNLVNLYDLMEDRGQWFFTMELIDGLNFVAHVRATAAGRNERLRLALRQLAAGLVALHDAHVLHRDVKPTNVLVTTTGRVVLLDFGLSTALGTGGIMENLGGRIVGTVLYMSPEQAAGLPLSTASDWYSVGGMLYECLTGVLPFQGTSDDVLIDKQTLDPLPPDQLASDVPRDLGSLCMDLLSRNFEGRPSGLEVLNRLAGLATETSLTPERPRRKIAALVGRESHLGTLEQAFQSMREGRAESVFIYGQSGSGKSTLLRSFLDSLTGRAGTVVLSGRCFERESVPYKALDCLIDALSRYLKQLPAREAEALLPRDVLLLARVFPVLLRVGVVAQAPRRAFEVPDQQESRRRAFAALRELLARISDRHPLVLAVDDLQWGDVDSAVLLNELMRPPEPPALLFLGCYRSEDTENSPFLRALLPAPAGNVRALAIDMLTQAEGRTLALALLGHDDGPAKARAHIIALESRGNPFFIAELANAVPTDEPPADRLAEARALVLEEVLWTRIVLLPEHARRLLETVAVSGRPISQADAFLASGLGPAGRSALAILRNRRLIRGTGLTHHDEIETYHDRIRETVVAHLNPEALEECHLALASALESSGRADPEVLAAHYLGANRREQAGRYYVSAADKAAETLAFARAATLYRLALDLRSDLDAEALGRLRAKLGDALANAGRGGEAARAYLGAAETANVADALELRRRAALQLLISGHVDEGMVALHTVLDAVGMKLPTCPRQALASVLWHRLRLRLRGLKFQQRDLSQISAESLTRIDACWSAVVGMSIIDPIFGSDFQARGLLLALDAGEPYRISRALAMGAAHVSTAGRPSIRRVARLLEPAERLAERVDHPHAHGMVALAKAISALILGRWKTAIELFDTAERTFLGRCTGVAWELDTIYFLALWAVTQIGDWHELRKRWPVHLKEAQERGNLYATTTLNTYYMTMLRLADDDPEGAQRELTAAMDLWTHQGFNIQHSIAYRSQHYIYMYMGNYGLAWDRINVIWPFYERSLLMRVQSTRIEMLERRARSALAVASAAADPRPYWRAAERGARLLNRERMDWADTFALHLRAGIAAQRGDRDRAAGLLRAAARGFDQLDMYLHAAVMRRRLGAIVGGTEGRQLSADADAWMDGQKIRQPARMADLYAPGYPVPRE